MLPFEISVPAGKLRGNYPAADLLVSVLRGGSQAEYRGLIRQWLSEGIPRAFEGSPLLYEAAREYLASGLGVHPKEITLVGSARIGYSLAPAPKFASGFSDTSDCDLAAVSPELFERCRRAFFRWLEDYNKGRVVPRHPAESGYWAENALRVPGNISRGFIDHWKIPIWDRYAEAQVIQERLQSLGKKVRITPGAPRFSKISLRIYRDWTAFVNQMELNLRRALDSTRGGAQQ